jgi:hypothetical protein
MIEIAWNSWFLWSGKLQSYWQSCQYLTSTIQQMLFSDSKLGHFEKGLKSLVRKEDLLQPLCASSAVLEQSACLCVCVRVSAISSIRQSLLRWPQKWLSQTSRPWKPCADWWKQNEAEQSATNCSWFVSGPLKHLPVVVGNFPRIRLKPLQRFLRVEKQIGGLK